MTEPNKNRILGEFSTRKTGNSLVITVPKNAGVPIGKKFTLVVKEDGSLVYRSNDNNPWLNGDFDDIDFRANLKEVGNYGLDEAQGKEKIDYDSQTR